MANERTWSLGLAAVLLVSCVERPLPSKSREGGTGGQAPSAGTGGWYIYPSDTGASGGGDPWSAGGGGTGSSAGGEAWGGAAGASALPDDATCGVDFDYPFVA